MDELLLCERFNKREVSAFSEVYALVFGELYSYTSKVYKNTEVDASDVIHDLFITIWNANTQFSSVLNIKAYLYSAVKNKFKNHLAHQKHVESYMQEHKKDDSYYDMLAVESEFHVLLSEMIACLPENYAQVIKMHLEGWDVKSIAEHLGITEKSVYNRKMKAIEILKKSISSNKLYLFIGFLSNL